MRLLADGSAVLYSGTSDMGQGARTIFAQIVAEELGVPVDRVAVVMGDTAIVPYDQQTSASRSTVIMGRAIQRACADIQSQGGAEAARLQGEVVGHGEQRKEADPDHPLGGTSAFFEFNATAVEVEVDRETGDVTVTRHVTVSDVGQGPQPDARSVARTRAPRSWDSATR